MFKSSASARLATEKLTLQLLTLLRFLPLPLLRGFGALLGWLLYGLMASRRHTVRVNLRLCFPAWSARAREQCVRQVFVHFMQSWLDRFWLWHGPQALLNQRLRIIALASPAQQGLPEGSLFKGQPTVIFAPHFFGLDAGWTALNRLTSQRMATIYSKQKNPALDAWVRAGRERCRAGAPPPLLIEHLASMRPALQALRRGEPLYLLPDMNYEPDDSFFLPFFGNTAATLPILARYAQLGGIGGHPAQVVPVITRMTRWGYEVQIHPPWQNYPSAAAPESSVDASSTDMAGKKAQAAQALLQDTLRMNRELEAWIAAMPAQYYWVHRRFKDQPRDASGKSGPNPYEAFHAYLQAQPKPQLKP